MPPIPQRPVNLLITDRPGNIVSTDGTYPLTINSLPPSPIRAAVFPSSFIQEMGLSVFVSYIHDLDWFIVNEVKLSAFFQPLYRILMITSTDLSAVPGILHGDIQKSQRNDYKTAVSPDCTYPKGKAGKLESAEQCSPKTWIFIFYFRSLTVCFCPRKSSPRI